MSGFKKAKAKAMEDESFASLCNNLTSEAEALEVGRSAVSKYASITQLYAIVDKCNTKYKQSLIDGYMEAKYEVKKQDNTSVMNKYRDRMTKQLVSNITTSVEAINVGRTLTILYDSLEDLLPIITDLRFRDTVVFGFNKARSVVVQ